MVLLMDGGKMLEVLDIKGESGEREESGKTLGSFHQ